MDNNTKVWVKVWNVTVNGKVKEYGFCDMYVNCCAVFRRKRDANTYAKWLKKTLGGENKIEIVPGLLTLFNEGGIRVNG